MIGPVLKNGLEIKMTGGIASRPYIDLTLWMMREFGADADWSDSETLKVNPHPYEQHKYLIESDWSASSYWYEMMTLAEDPESMVMFDGLFDASKQGRLHREVYILAYGRENPLPIQRHGGCSNGKTEEMALPICHDSTMTSFRRQTLHRP